MSWTRQKRSKRSKIYAAAAGGMSDGLLHFIESVFGEENCARIYKSKAMPLIAHQIQENGISVAKDDVPPVYSVLLKWLALQKQAASTYLGSRPEE